MLLLLLSLLLGVRDWRFYLPLRSCFVLLHHLIAIDCLSWSLDDRLRLLERGLKILRLLKRGLKSTTLLTQLDLVVPRLKTDWLLVQRDFGARANVKREL